MMLNEITTSAGKRKRRKRVGRGESSGLGKTCGRGNKGCKSRSGGGTRALSEGGQMPIFRRLPKRGFNNFNFRVSYDVVNLGDLEQSFANGDTIDPDILKKLRLVNGAEPVKILAKGALSKKLTVHAHGFSALAKEAIEKAGGKTVLIPTRDSAALARAKRKTAKARRPESKPSRLEKKKQAVGQN
jgi:large subunit ribosomal protein L15